MRKAIIIFIFLLSACGGGAKYVNPLTPEIRSSIFVKSVNVAWTDEAVAKASRLAPDDQAKRTELASAIQNTVGDAFRESPSGTDAVTIRVKLSAGGTSAASGTVEVVRNRDDALLASYDVVVFVGRSGLMKMVQGQDSKIGEVAHRFAYDLQSRFYYR